ncbi:MAG: DUF1800 family protein, partial [Mucilaginibacter sp.]
MDNLLQVKHLYARAGFGLRFGDVNSAGSRVKQALSALFKTSENPQPINTVKQSAGYSMLNKGDKEQKKQFMQLQRQQEKDLNVAWLSHMSTTDAVLREKMTLFWHNHFACR